jgi:hypothetical protein
VLDLEAIKYPSCIKKLFSLVSLRKIISAPLLTIAASLLNVFLLGLEMLSEQTFWVEKLILGNFFSEGLAVLFAFIRLGI